MKLQNIKANVCRKLAVDVALGNDYQVIGRGIVIATEVELVIRHNTLSTLIVCKM